MELKPIVKLQDLFKYKKLGIKVERDYAQCIQTLLLNKCGNFKRAALYSGVNHATLREIQKRNVRVFNWKKILSLLDIHPNEIEKYVVHISDRKNYHIRFPYSVSPLLIRLAAHTIGDGGYYGGARWIQKDTDPIIDLQRQLLGVSGKKVFCKNNVEQVAISDFYIKLACASINIERSQVCSEHLIKNCMGLPKDYKVQILAALIEDESKIQPKSGVVRIAMKNYRIIESLAKIMDNLGYDRSRIIKIKNNGTYSNNKNNFLYNLNLRILGSHKFYNDLNEAINKYGKLAGLWKKQKQLQDLILFNDGRKARGEKLNSKLAKKAICLMKENNGTITYKELKRFLNVSHHRIGSVVRRLYNKGILRKDRRGCYTLLK